MKLEYKLETIHELLFDMTELAGEAYKRADNLCFSEDAPERYIKELKEKSIKLNMLLTEV